MTLSHGGGLSVENGGIKCIWLMKEIALTAIRLDIQTLTI